MTEIAREIPDVAVLLDLAQEELAGNLFFVMRKRMDDPQYKTMAGYGEMFHFGNMVAELWNTRPAQPPYAREKKKEVDLALAEAWSWLEAQGVLISSPDDNGRNGWRVLSRRARKMESQAEFADFKTARLLPKELLHPKIADSVWGSFMRGRYDSTVFEAMKGVEVVVRDAAGFGNEEYGTGD